MFTGLDLLSDFKKISYRGKQLEPNKPVPSDRKNKKKMVLASKKVNGKTKYKLVHYGHPDYEDYTTHKDKNRRKNYLKRSAGIKNKQGKLTKDDKFSPNYWARKDLW
jgi:hypothetical protein